MLLKALVFTILLFPPASIAVGDYKNDILNEPLEKRQIMNMEKVFPILKDLSIPEKIAFWAEFFKGVQYDKVPVGLYVQNMTIKEDTALDCISLTFRSVELANANTANEALDIALEKRFIKKGRRNNNHVISYDGRFEYGEDMVLSGKYGKNITNTLGKSEYKKTDRLKKKINVLPVSEALKSLEKFETGDIIFFGMFTFRA